jgi:hypothetical protein
VIENDRIQYYLTLKHELPNVEFKGPGNKWDNPLFGKVIRAAIGMANRPGGGTIIIGVAEEATGLSFCGLPDEQRKTWKYEEIADGFNKYAEPPILFDRQEYEQDGNTFLVLDIHEFTDAPIICKEEYKDKSNPKTPDEHCKVILRSGAFYVRSVNKPETKEVLGIEGMRPILQLAIDKGIRAFVTHAQIVGLPISAEARVNTRASFEEQLQGWSSPLLDKIRSRGYWHVGIRPFTFEQERIPLSELFPLIRRTSFNIRGWDFPIIEGINANARETGTYWVSVENEWDRILEAWRMYQSGQFVHESGIFDDWLDLSKHTPAGEQWRPGIQLSVVGAVYRMTEIFEFAARLAVADAYRMDKSIVIEVTLHNTKGRALYDPGTYAQFPRQGRFPMIDRYVTSAEIIPYRGEFLKEKIVAQPWDLALDTAQYLFERFGWNPSKDLLKSIQSEIKPNWLKTDE